MSWGMSRGLDGWGVGATGGSTGYAEQSFAKLSASAIVDLGASPDIVEQCSYIGQFYAVATSLATAQAAVEGGLTLGELKAAAIPALEQILALMNTLLPELVEDLEAGVRSALAAAGDALGDSLPLIGTIVKGVIDIYLTFASADARDAPMNAEHCRDLYTPPALGTGLGGEVYPCDLVAGSLGDLIDLSIASGHFESGWFYGSDPDGKPFHRKLKGHPGIPAKERKLLLTLFWAIRNSRNHPEGDGGVALWPIFVDLLYAQFQKRRIGWDGIYYRYCKVQLWRGPSPGWCCEHGAERRAFDQYKELMRRWGLTIDPLYVQDRAKAKEMRAALAAAEESLLSGGDGKPRPKLSIPRVVRSSGKGSTLALAGGAALGLTKLLGWW